MPKVRANNITMNYDQQGTGEPLVLIDFCRRSRLLCLPSGSVSECPRMTFGK